MKITVAKIRRELRNNYGFDKNYLILHDYIIRDTLKILNKILIEQKGISIK